VLVIERRNSPLDAGSSVELANSRRAETFLVVAKKVHALHFRMPLIDGGKLPDLVVPPID
jgi:hypothetical protein